MNPNDVLAQQQAYLNQMMAHSQHTMWGIIAMYIALSILGAIVLYLFYSRLRDIADELRKLRIAFEMAEDRKASAARLAATSPSSSSGGYSTTADDRFKPKSGK